MHCVHCVLVKIDWHSGWHRVHISGKEGTLVRQRLRLRRHLCVSWREGSQRRIDQFNMRLLCRTQDYSGNARTRRRTERGEGNEDGGSRLTLPYWLPTELQCKSVVGLKS